MAGQVEGRDRSVELQGTGVLPRGPRLPFQVNKNGQFCIVHTLHIKFNMNRNINDLIQRHE